MTEIVEVGVPVDPADIVAASSLLSGCVVMGIDVNNDRPDEHWNAHFVDCYIMGVDGEWLVVNLKDKIYDDSRTEPLYQERARLSFKIKRCSFTMTKNAALEVKTGLMKFIVIPQKAK